jgi:hypothetical protein
VHDLRASPNAYGEQLASIRPGPETMLASGDGVPESPAGYIRGGAGLPTDSRHVLRIAAGVLLAALAVLAIVLTVTAAHQNTRRHRLQQHGVGVQVTVTGCVGEATGSGITVDGFTCRGSFTLNGHRYNEVIGDSAQLLTPGHVLQGVTDPASPSTLSTAAAVRASAANSDWRAYIPPAILYGLLIVAAGVFWWSRQRHRLPV